MYREYGNGQKIFMEHDGKKFPIFIKLDINEDVSTEQDQISSQYFYSLALKTKPNLMTHPYFLNDIINLEMDADRELELLTVLISCNNAASERNNKQIRDFEYFFPRRV